ncbi:unnamed protein product [Toxocara canis]|uniref:Uncharacterized protein n=1 Tax=Toxocara canis TaxID=6265 RepID=A0A3P7FHD1_TOXCA|nr:unnamed protein product [Toxocara canis]
MMYFPVREQQSASRSVQTFGAYSDAISTALSIAVTSKNRSVGTCTLEAKRMWTSWGDVVPMTIDKKERKESEKGLVLRRGHVWGSGNSSVSIPLQLTFISISGMMVGIPFNGGLRQVEYGSKLLENQGLQLTGQ